MAYFRCIQISRNRTFVIDVPSRSRIKEARSILSGTEKKKVHVVGTIVKQSKPYNWPWSWHLDPATIEFFEVSTEVCDAAIEDVEKLLADVGGDFLPRNQWCPWASTVMEEITETSDETPDA